jgi:hypothetical protein
MSIPGFTADTSLRASRGPYVRQPHAPSPRGVFLQLPFLACAVYAGLCVAASEDPPAAAYCWWDFARRCGGAEA